MSRRVTVDDLEHAATWLDAYEAEDGDGARNPDNGPYTGDDEVAARMYAVADWLRREAAQRREDAAVREIIARVEGMGRRINPAAARRLLRDKATQAPH